MKVAMLSLSVPGARVIGQLRPHFKDVDIYLHSQLEGAEEGCRFDKVLELVPTIFHGYDAFVFVMPCGVIVRALAGLPSDKHQDPAVVMVDVGGRYAVSLLSGHEGGANALSVKVANILGAEPVITTTSEAVKTVIAGVGCRRGTSAHQLIKAIRDATVQADVGIEEIRYIATADIKSDEEGLVEAARQLDIPLRFIPSDLIRSTRREFTCTPLAQERVNLPAVAEPSALLAGQRTELILPKTKFDGITVALARERCSSLE